MLSSSQWPIDPQDQFPEYWTGQREAIGSYSNEYLPGRFFSRRDLNFISSVNYELLGDIVECIVQIYKVAVGETSYNIYGESTENTGKVFYDAVNMRTLVQREDITGDTNEGYGVDRNQSVVYKFLERDCIYQNYFPEIGDYVYYNSRYYEINNVIQEQFLGGIPDKSLSFICNTHYTRVSRINTVKKRQT